MMYDMLAMGLLTTLSRTRDGAVLSWIAEVCRVQYQRLDHVLIMHVKLSRCAAALLIRPTITVSARMDGSMHGRRRAYLGSGRSHVESKSHEVRALVLVARGPGLGQQFAGGKHG